MFSQHSCLVAAAHTRHAAAFSSDLIGASGLDRLGYLSGRKYTHPTSFRERSLIGRPDPTAHLGARFDLAKNFATVVGVTRRITV